jgi:fumarylacetoacetase
LGKHPARPIPGQVIRHPNRRLVVPLAALAPYRRPNPSARAAISNLRHDAEYAFDIQFSVGIRAASMRRAAITGRSNATDLYWDGAQQLVHMTANGACVRPSDLYGSGTISGAADESSGCLLERVPRVAARC